MKVAMLSPLPTVADHPSESGVATYTEALIRSMNADFEVTVLAQKDAEPDQLGPAKVARVWTPSVRFPLQIFGALARAKPGILHVQHEFNLYGGLLQGFLLIGIVMAHRLLGIRTITTIHGVVAPEDVTEQFVARNGLPQSLGSVRAAFGLSYRGIKASSDLVIVHHDYFRNVLVRAYGMPANRVFVIPHGAPEYRNYTRQGQADSGKNILCLGFLTGYKLPEVLVEVAESDALPGARFSFCIGANPRIATHRYRERYADLERRVKALGSRATWNGYIPDEALTATFDQARVLVLPYTECVSSSGVAALARRTHTRICHSRALRPLFGSGPFEFELNAQALAEAISRALSIETEASNGESLFRGFTSWRDAALATQSAWNHVLALR